MSRRDRDFLTRSESKKRSNRTQGRKKLDRLLNVLIAIVAVLILINLYFVFSNNEEKAQDELSENVSNNDQNDSDQTTNSNSTSNTDDADNTTTDTNVKDENNNSSEISNGVNHDAGNESDKSSNLSSETIIVQGSSDPVVEQVIIDTNWQVNPTKQTGEHVSTYEEGHIDYEEKKETIQNAVNLASDNIIFWRIQNNGSNKNAIAVVSSMDKSKKYRVSIEWIENQGWKPVKVEIVNDIEGAF